MADKGVIVEFDFAAANGAETLRKTVGKFLKDLDGIPFNPKIEAREFAGRDYLDAFARRFAAAKTKKTAAKAAKEFPTAFAKALAAAVPKAVTPTFRNFVKALADKGVKVVIATRAPLEDVQDAFEGLVGDNVILQHEDSPGYGAFKWDSWRRLCATNRIHRTSAVAVTGSGYGVKSALVAGLGSVAVSNEAVAYQDFGGADDVVRELSGTTAKRVLQALRIEC